AHQSATAPMTMQAVRLMDMETTPLCGFKTHNHLSLGGAAPQTLDFRQASLSGSSPCRTRDARPGYRHVLVTTAQRPKIALQWRYADHYLNQIPGNVTMQNRQLQCCWVRCAKN